MTKRQELEENMDEIKNMLTYMFKSVFVHRYRSVHSLREFIICSLNCCYMNTLVACTGNITYQQMKCLAVTNVF